MMVPLTSMINNVVSHSTILCIQSTQSTATIPIEALEECTLDLGGMDVNIDVVTY